jgi:hypothetical protein
VDFMCNWHFLVRCIAVALLGGSVSFLSTGRSVKASGRAPIAPTPPFSAAIVITHYWPDGTGRVALRSTWNYYRFTDGSYAQRNFRELEPDEGPGMDKVVDLRMRQELFLEPITKSVITLKYPPGEQLNEMEGAWEENCPGEDDSLESSEAGGIFFGYPTVHVVKNFDSTWREERWMIRELRCFSVKEIDVAGAAKNEHETMSLVLGEPPRSVLSAPAGYVERSPAEAAKAYAMAKGGDQLFGGALSKLTKDYNRGRQIE